MYRCQFCQFSACLNQIGLTAEQLKLSQPNSVSDRMDNFVLFVLSSNRIHGSGGRAKNSSLLSSYDADLKSGAKIINCDAGRKGATFGTDPSTSVRSTFHVTRNVVRVRSFVADCRERERNALSTDSSQRISPRTSLSMRERLSGQAFPQINRGRKEGVVAADPLQMRFR